MPFAYISSSFHLHLLGLVSQIVSRGLCCMGNGRKGKPPCRGSTHEDLGQEVPVVEVAERALSLLFHGALLYFFILMVSCH